MIAQAYEGACIDQLLGKSVVFLFGTINPVDTVGLGEGCNLAHPFKQTGMGGRCVLQVFF